MRIFVRLSTVILLVFTSTLFIHCTKSQPHFDQTPIKVSYIPFGDSYTIGEGVNEADRWPNQLAAQLEAKANITVEILDNPSRNGFQTQNVLDQELRVLDTHQPDFITLLIGANDHYRKVPIHKFEKNFVKIIETIQLKSPESRILIINIPDYGRTLLGRRIGDVNLTSKSIQAFNQIIDKHAQAFDLPVANIFNISQDLGNQVVTDGLHPNAKQYGAWVKEIFPAVEQLLR